MRLAAMCPDVPCALNRVGNIGTFHSVRSPSTQYYNVHHVTF
jgi:hypothetical protein